MARIMQIISTCERRGAEIHTRALSKVFARLGHTVVIVFPPGEYAKDFKSLEKCGVICLEIPFTRNWLKTIASIRSILKQYRIEIIHSHVHMADMHATFARIMIPGIKQVTTIHSTIRLWETGVLSKLRMYLYASIAYLFIDRIFPVSEGAAQLTREDFFFARKKIIPLLNAIDFEGVQVNPGNKDRIQRQIFPDDNLAPVIMCAGTLIESKGQQYVIEALAMLSSSDVRCVLLGEGPQEVELKEIAIHFNVVDRVLFAGYCADIIDWLDVADIYVQISAHDALPNALIEAMYLGIPPIVSDISTIAEIVENGVHGIAVPPRSPRLLASAIEEMLADSDKRKKYGAASRECVTKKCSMDRLAREILENTLHVNMRGS